MGNFSCRGFPSSSLKWIRIRPLYIVSRGYNSRGWTLFCKRRSSWISLAEIFGYELCKLTHYRPIRYTLYTEPYWLISVWQNVERFMPRLPYKGRLVHHYTNGCLIQWDWLLSVLYRLSHHVDSCSTGFRSFPTDSPTHNWPAASAQLYSDNELISQKNYSQQSAWSYLDQLSEWSQYWRCLHSQSFLYRPSASHAPTDFIGCFLSQPTLHVSNKDEY